MKLTVHIKLMRDIIDKDTNDTLERRLRRVFPLQHFHYFIDIRFIPII
jgi:hypothetical protein